MVGLLTTKEAARLVEEGRAVMEKVESCFGGRMLDEDKKSRCCSFPKAPPSELREMEAVPAYKVLHGGSLGAETWQESMIRQEERERAARPEMEYKKE